MLRGRLMSLLAVDSFAVFRQTPGSAVTIGCNSINWMQSWKVFLSALVQALQNVTLLRTWRRLDFFPGTNIFLSSSFFKMNARSTKICKKDSMCPFFSASDQGHTLHLWGNWQVTLQRSVLSSLYNCPLERVLWNAFIWEHLTLSTDSMVWWFLSRLTLKWTSQSSENI